ncbi:MAG TPA: heparan-alpha-glucosaminide N-acetyltransferase domain-containing protein, partial [Pyrinomonadaceae bacterium]
MTKLDRRILSVDLLRGIVMIIMLLDHTREYVNADAFLFSPTDLSKTTFALFFTRWITHFCAPTFVFLSGVSIYLQKIRGKSGPELTRFLLTRGLWLIVLEFTVVRFAVFFDFDYSLLGIAEVIWVFGVSMIVMALIVRLPTWVSGVFGLALIFGHNLLDKAGPAPAMGGEINTVQAIWIFLHQPGFVPLFGGATKLFVAYPLLPWIGVMAAGYALGKVYEWDSDRRKRTLLIVGSIATVVFIVLRFSNVYGDPSPWISQPREGFTVLSFLNTTKYPVSLLFLLMTLGPALIFLGLTDRVRGENIVERIAITYGRVPLFYFILQMIVAHLAGVILGYFAGFNVGFWFTNYPFSDTVKPPEGYGFSLATTCAAWLVGLIVLYPICLLYGDLKRRSGHW